MLTGQYGKHIEYGTLGNFRMVAPVMPYQGSKRKIAKTILGYFPSGTKRVVEPFAGSASISIHAVHSRVAPSAWVNDAHEPLIVLWGKIIHDPKGLADGYESLWNGQAGNEREFFVTVRERFNRTRDPADFLYLLARCVKAAVRFNRNGEFNNSPDNRRLGAKPEVMRCRIMAVSAILSDKITLTSKDYRQVMEGCTKDDLVYMDPPWQGTSGARDKRYHGDFDHDEFCDSLEELESRRIPFILSYDGMSGNKSYGKAMPKSLKLRHVTIHAGRSTQSTLLGGTANTYESLYISPDV